MKKVLFFTVLVICVLMAAACASKPAAAASTEPITTQAETDDALQKVYEEFKGDLILDGAKSYTVVKGDTLSAISRQQYSNGFYFPLIMLASSDIVLDPDRIEPGMVLTVPDVQRNLNDARAKGRIKEFLEEIAKIEDRRSRPEDAKGLRQLAASL